MTLHLTGQSGREYHYLPTDVSTIRTNFLWQAPANFVFARPVPPSQVLIFIGEAENLALALSSERFWKMLTERFHATQLYARPNANAQSRKDERDDLVAAYEPPMNAVYQE